MGLFRQKIEIKRKDDTSEYTIDACARIGGEPLFTQGKIDGSDPNAMALYVIGDDELWVNYNAVQARKKEIELGEGVAEPTAELLTQVAFNSAEQSFVDKETGKHMYLYRLDDGKVVKFSPEEVTAERKRLMAKTGAYDRLEDVARRNECIILNGHKDCDVSVGVWLTSNGKMARYTVGAVKAKRRELGLEQDNQEENQAE